MTTSEQYLRSPHLLHGLVYKGAADRRDTHLPRRRGVPVVEV